MAKFLHPAPGIVIVGAGFAGIEVAKCLADCPVRVTVIDRRNYTLFQPLLYQVATAALSASDVAVPIRSLLRAPNIEIVMDEVTDIDLAQSRLCTASGREMSFATLVLATGSHYNYFGRDDWARVAPAPKTLEDALAIRAKLLLAFERAEMCGDEAERRALMSFVIIGGGATGVEMAGAVAELARAALARDFRRIDPSSARILLVEAGPQLLSAFPDKLRRYAHRALTRLGVEVVLNAKVDEIDATGVTAAGRHIEARTIIWGAGVAASPVADWLHVAAGRHGTVLVESDFSVPGHPNLFVVGDAAGTTGADGKPLPGLASVAKQEGRYVGALLRRRLHGEQSPERPFHYRDYGTMATIGRGAAVADLRGFQLTGAIAWLLWGTVHLYFLIGLRNRLLVLLKWLWAWATYARGARIILPQRGADIILPEGARDTHSDAEQRRRKA